MERARASGYAAELSDTDGAERRYDLVKDLMDSHWPLRSRPVSPGRTRFRAPPRNYSRDRLSRLPGKRRRTAPPRHQTLNAMLDWSYNLLSKHEKLVLRRLSVFVGDFTLQSAGSVASEGDVDPADITSAIVGLTEKSLITATELNGSTYYRLLDTTRAYAVPSPSNKVKLIVWARRQAIIYSEFLKT